MKAYVSLHTSRPTSQLDNEATYTGYARVEIDYDEERLEKNFLAIQFPIVQPGKSNDIACFMAIGTAEKGQGELLMTVPVLPNLDLRDDPRRRTIGFWLDNGAQSGQVDTLMKDYGHIAPTVSIGTTGTMKLPADMNPIAALTYRLFLRGLLLACDLHPKIYEAVNDELIKFGIEPMPVIRQAAAHMKQTPGWGLEALGELSAHH